jgi:uncharacterized protein YjbI with pentapeptide repeats
MKTRLCITIALIAPLLASCQSGSFFKWGQQRGPECLKRGDLNCEGADLRGQDLSSAELKGFNLRGAQLTGSDLSNADLRGANLSDATLIGTDLESAQLQGARLQRALLRDADIESANLSGADIRDADLEGSDAESAKFIRANLSNVKFRGADLESADFLEAKAIGINLIGASLGKARLNKANFSQANLEASDLGSARLAETNLTGANLTLARLSPRIILSTTTQVKAKGSKTSAVALRTKPNNTADDILEASGLSDDSRVGALIIKTDFTNANLKDADMGNTILYQVNLNKANLTGANLIGSRWINVTRDGTICSTSKGKREDCTQYTQNNQATIKQALSYLNWLKVRPYPED